MLIPFALAAVPSDDPSHIALVQHVQTQQGSRTGTLDPDTGRLYLMASKPDPNAAPPPSGRGAPRLAGSWEVLVIGPLWRTVAPHDHKLAMKRTAPRNLEQLPSDALRTRSRHYRSGVKRPSEAAEAKGAFKV